MAKIEFDLQKALDGTHKICDEQENILTDWHYFNNAVNDRFRLVVTTENNRWYSFTDAGNSTCGRQLYLYVEEKKQYRNVYNTSSGAWYDTMEGAREGAITKSNPLYIVEHNIATGECKVVHTYKTCGDVE